MKVFVGASVILLILSVAAHADIYKYVDEDGVILYTDAPIGQKVEKTKGKISVSTKKTDSIKRSSSTASRNENYRPIVDKKAKEHEIDPSLVSAVIKAESNWNPHAISRKGAMGLMQLMPMTASDLQVRNPFDPEENIDGGIRYLRYLIEKFNGNLTLALAAYNAGPTTVEKYGSVPPISETKQYVKKVLALYNGKFDSSAFSPSKSKKSEPIYKIILEDGTILFTNFPAYKSNSLRF
jgi:hypothetical protein